MPRELQGCGTPAAYKRHCRNGEEPCRPCKKANSKRVARTNRIWLNTLQALADRYPDDYAEIRKEQAALYDREQAAGEELRRQQADQAWAAVFAEVADA